MNFVYSKMNEECQAHLHSWISEGELKFPSLDSMLTVLGILFDDPNRVRDAKVRLHSNPQRNKPFSAWIAEIRRDAAISGYDKHPEPLRDIIFLNLSLELKQAIIHEKDIEDLDLDQAIARLQDIENKQKSFADSWAKLGPRKPFFPINSTLSRPNSIDKLTTTQGGDAMDLSASQLQPHGPLNPQERERRRKLGLCYYCGNGRHKATECRIKMNRSAVSGHLAEVSTSEVVGSSENA